MLTTAMASYSKCPLWTKAVHLNLPPLVQRQPIQQASKHGGAARHVRVRARAVSALGAARQLSPPKAAAPLVYQPAQNALHGLALGPRHAGLTGLGLVGQVAVEELVQRAYGRCQLARVFDAGLQTIWGTKTGSIFCFEGRKSIQAKDTMDITM